MKRTRIIYGAAAAAVFAVVGYAVYEDKQDADTGTPVAALDSTSAEEYIAQDRWGRLGDMYREIVPNATDDQIEAWEADREAYEAEVAEAEQCELDAIADQDAAGAEQDAISAEMDAIPLEDEAGYAAAEERYNSAVDDYNAALDAEAACSHRINVSLIQDHPFYEVDGDTVTYYGP